MPHARGKVQVSIHTLDGTCTRDPNMNLIIQYGLLGLVLGLGLGLGFILYCRIWRPWNYRTCAHSQSVDPSAWALIIRRVRPKDGGGVDSACRTT